MNNEMTIQQESSRNRDRFSWLGVWDVTKFWWPVLKWEFWILIHCIGVRTGGKR